MDSVQVLEHTTAGAKKSVKVVQNECGRIRTHQELPSSSKAGLGSPPEVNRPRKGVNTPPPKVTNFTKRLTIVACPTELIKSAEVLSLLKHSHGCDVVMAKGSVQNGSCFMVSTRTAVARLTTEEFCNAR